MIEMGAEPNYDIDDLESLVEPFSLDTALNPAVVKGHIGVVCLLYGYEDNPDQVDELDEMLIRICGEEFRRGALHLGTEWCRRSLFR